MGYSCKLDFARATLTSRGFMSSLQRNVLRLFEWRSTACHCLGGASQAMSNGAAPTNRRFRTRVCNVFQPFASAGLGSWNEKYGTTCGREMLRTHDRKDNCPSALRSRYASKSSRKYQRRKCSLKPLAAGTTPPVT